MTKTLDSRWVATKRFMSTEEQKLVVGRVDRMSREFLEWIVWRCQCPSPLYIQEVVMESDIASPATVHKSIAVLEQAKLVEVKVDPEDLRRRRIHPTPLALQELRRLDAAFQNWIKKQA